MPGTYREQGHEVQCKEGYDGIDPVEHPSTQSERPSKTLRAPCRRRSTATQLPPGSFEARTRRSSVGELDRLLDSSSERRWVCALYSLEDRTTLEGQEGRHGSDAVGLGDGRLGVGVDLAEGYLAGFGVFRGQRLEGRRDHLAWTAPVGVDCEARCQLCRIKRTGALLAYNLR
jgi:hypothetical protein